MTHPWFAAGRTPRVLAHRGLVTPEAEALGVVDNSLTAIAAAQAAGATYIETDCRVTADGVVVLFHDEDLVRIAGDSRRIADLTAADVDGVLSDRGGLLTLDDALDGFPEVRFNLDVKVDDAVAPVGALVRHHADRVLLTSFSDRRRRAALAAARPGRPATSAGSTTVLAVLLTTTLGLRGLTRRLLRGIHALQVPERHGALRVVTARFVAAVHDAGAEVHVWTVNDMDDARRLLRLGVDGIVTDRADVALGAMARYRPGFA